MIPAACSLFSFLPMPQLILVLLLAATGALVYANERGKVHLQKGESKRFVFASGSSEENASKLRILFDNVVDEGNGSYLVTSSSDSTIVVPEGARIAGAATIQLYSMFDKNQHIGFAFGAGPASAIKRAYPVLTFKLSTQKYPKTWGSQWMPVWGDYSHQTIWGRFVYPYDKVIADYMVSKGYQAYNEPNPTWKTSAEWDRLAMR